MFGFFLQVLLSSFFHNTMQQKTIDLILDFYIKERIPNADAILEESTNDFHLVKERCHTFSFAPTPPQCVLDDFKAESTQEVSPLVKGRSLTFSFGPTPHVHHHLQAGFVCQGLEEPSPLHSTDVIDGLDKKEQKCRDVARKLAKMADEFQEHYMNSSHNRSLHSFSEKHENGFTPEERNTVQRIYSAGASQSVSRIASALTSCFTSQTLQAAVQYLSGQSDDVSQQLAITLELSTHVVRLMGGRVLGTIRNVITEVFQHRAKLEDL